MGLVTGSSRLCLMRSFCKACALCAVIGCGYSQVNPRGVQEVGGFAHDGTRAVVEVVSGGGSAKGALLDSAIAAPIGIVIGAASVVTPGPLLTGPTRSQLSSQISENEKDPGERSSPSRTAARECGEIVPFII